MSRSGLVDVMRLEQAMVNVTVALGREWDGLYSGHAPEIAAEYDRLANPTLGRGRVTNRRLDMRLKENRYPSPGGSR